MRISNPKTITNEQILPLIQNSFAGNLESVILYGSALTESFNPFSSDINILILLNKNNVSSFLQFGKKSAAILKKYRFTIFIMTSAEFMASADVFPMEYSDIIDKNVIIYGENILDKAKITNSNLRLELEERLRGFSNQLRQSLIFYSKNKKKLKEIFKTIQPAIKTLMRSALRIANVSIKDIPDNMILFETEKIYGIDMSVFKAAQYIEKNDDITSIASSVLDSLEKITAKIDNINKSASAQIKPVKTVVKNKTGKNSNVIKTKTVVKKTVLSDNKNKQPVKKSVFPKTKKTNQTGKINAKK